MRCASAASAVGNKTVVKGLHPFGFAKKSISHSRISIAARTCTTVPVSPDSGRLSDYKTVAYDVGTRIHGFEVRRVTRVDNFHLTAVELEHVVTGSPYLHIARQDENNVFSVGMF